MRFGTLATVQTEVLEQVEGLLDNLIVALTRCCETDAIVKFKVKLAAKMLTQNIDIDSWSGEIPQTYEFDILSGPVANISPT